MDRYSAQLPFFHSKTQNDIALRQLALSEGKASSYDSTLHRVMQIADISLDARPVVDPGECSSESSSKDCVHDIKVMDTLKEFDVEAYFIESVGPKEDNVCPSLNPTILLLEMISYSSLKPFSNRLLPRTDRIVREAVMDLTDMLFENRKEEILSFQEYICLKKKVFFVIAYFINQLCVGKESGYKCFKLSKATGFIEECEITQFPEIDYAKKMDSEGRFMDNCMAMQWFDNRQVVYIGNFRRGLFHGLGVLVFLDSLLPHFGFFDGGRLKSGGGFSWSADKKHFCLGKIEKFMATEDSKILSCEHPFFKFSKLSFFSQS